MMLRLMLSDAMWQKIGPLLACKSGRRAGPAKNNRLVVEGVLWRFRTGAPWRDLPEAFGPSGMSVGIGRICGYPIAMQAATYILANRYRNVLYVGVTNNLARRVYEHKQKLNQGFTSQYKVDQLVSRAISVEYRRDRSRKDDQEEVQARQNQTHRIHKP